MGNVPSTPENPRFQAATRSFTHTELDELKSLFHTLTSSSNSKEEYISPSVFQSYFGIDGLLGGRLYDLMTQLRKDNKLSFQDFVIAKSVYEKGTSDDIANFIFQLLDVNGDGIVTRSDLQSVLETILGSIFHYKSSDLEPGRPGFEVPLLEVPQNIEPNIPLLKKEFAWHICGALSQHVTGEWKLLYNSDVDGLSFNTFFGRVSSHKASTVLIIRDKGGHIYGGYASQPWERHSDFYGDLKSFIFQLHPKALVFKPTGANNNIHLQ